MEVAEIILITLGVICGVTIVVIGLVWWFAPCDSCLELD